MRVGAGIILSVLSSSVLAAVIPNYGDHVPLLVRRTVNPENRVVLWKRADEKQTGPGPSNSGAGASSEASTSNGQSNPDDSAGDIKYLYAGEYKDFISKVEPKNNEKNIQIIEKYLSEANEYWKSLEAVADYNQNLINNGKVTFTKKASKKTSTSATRVKKRPGMKTKPPTDETPDQETSDQGVGQSVNGIFG
ncbi:hypothetical protein BASA50_011099 [Batrachochytrium salamandrivorans]|uniref:Uncharacterized protein n=1 Tax=Batrachochytrium salamandrivorans TaxID=1357716 RepID=A0ABQ8EXM1_9FUNG|nr:hypothetical protein BASA50_011099 [Batrachochytrium salamandrivorans]